MSTKHSDRPELGIVLMICSALSFSFMILFIRMLPELPFTQKVLFRNLISLVIAFIVLDKAVLKSELCPPKGTRWLLTSRCLMGLAGVLLNFYAIGKLPVAESTMLNRLSPFFVTFFASLFLKEHLRRVDKTALVLVFLFALMIIKPRFDLSVLPAFCGFLSGACAGGAYTILRALKGKISPSVIVFYFSLSSVVLMLLPIFYFAWLNPDSEQLANFFMMPNLKQGLLLLGIGLGASGGQFCITNAYRFAPAGEVSIYNYTGLVFSLLLGWFVLGEWPDIWSITGSVMIVLIALSLFVYNKRRQKKSDAA